MANPPDDDPKVSNIVFFIQKMLDKHIQGKMSAEAWERYEMMELGFNPNKPKDVEKYKEFVDSTFKEFVRATSKKSDRLIDYLYKPGDDDDDPGDDEDYEKEFVRATSEKSDRLIDYLYKPGDDDDDPGDDEDYEKDIEFIPEFELDDDEDEQEEDK